MSSAFDILIVGGGLVGSSLAIALEGSGLRVGLVEAAAPQVSAQPSYDERNLALARASINALESLGVWAHAGGEAAPIRRIHVSRRGDFGTVDLDATELGLPDFGAVLPARVLGGGLLARLAECHALERIAPAEVIGVDAESDALRVLVRAGAAERELRTRLLVGADGTQSFVRGQAGIGTQTVDYAQSALVTTITCEQDLAGRAFERFTDSGPLALLPLGGRRAGLVLSVPSAEAQATAELDDAAFIDLVQQRFGFRLGRLGQPGRRKPYPLMRVMADALTAPRTVLVGNAAQTVHPLGAQGFNLGLRDALTLAELLEEAKSTGTDPGAPALLARHVERRRPDRDATTSFSDELVRLMGHSAAPLRLLRSLGFGLLERSTQLKRRVALRGMGFRGDVAKRALSP